MGKSSPGNTKLQAPTAVIFGHCDTLNLSQRVSLSSLSASHILAFHSATSYNAIMKSYVPLVCVLLLLVVGLTIGCSREQATEVQVVDFDRLLTNPGQYNGQYVTIEGFFFHGFETIALSEDLEYSGFAEGHLVPKGRMLWIEGVISGQVYDRLSQRRGQ